MTNNEFNKLKQQLVDTIKFVGEKYDDGFRVMDSEYNTRLIKQHNYYFLFNRGYWNELKDTKCKALVYEYIVNDLNEKYNQNIKVNFDILEDRDFCGFNHIYNTLNIQLNYKRIGFEETLYQIANQFFNGIHSNNFYANLNNLTKEDFFNSPYSCIKKYCGKIPESERILLEELYNAKIIEETFGFMEQLLYDYNYYEGDNNPRYKTLKNQVLFASGTSIYKTMKQNNISWEKIDEIQQKIYSNYQNQIIDENYLK